MDQTNGLEAKISNEEARTPLPMDLRETSPLLFKIPFLDQISHMGTTIRIMGDHMIKAQINHSIEVKETDLEMDLSTIKLETGETMEDFRAPHRLKRQFSKINHTANEEVINLTFLFSADLTTDRPTANFTR